MANSRSFSTASAVASPVPQAARATADRTAPPARHHRLRAVDQDEVVDVADLLTPGATWLPAPPHALPTLPGRPPMVGYLVLVPAGQQPPVAPAATQERPAGAGPVTIDTVRRTARVDGREMDLT